MLPDHVELLPLSGEERKPGQLLSMVTRHGLVVQRRRPVVEASWNSKGVGHRAQRNMPVLVDQIVQ